MEADVVTPYGTAPGEQSPTLFHGIWRLLQPGGPDHYWTLHRTLMRLSVIDGVVAWIVAGLCAACLKDNPDQFSRAGV